MRKFDKYTVKQKYQIMLKCLTYALTDNTGLKRKTDDIGVACYYGKCYGVRRSDFDMIKDLSFSELIEILKDE